MKKVWRIIKLPFIFCIAIIAVGYLLPNRVSSPIAQNNIDKIDTQSFWYYPWGESGVHKGIDIFCNKGTDVEAPVYGLIVRKGYGTLGGNYVYLLGPKWRLYYFAHLDTILVEKFDIVSKGEILGKTGNTGNAINKPVHLHYSIETLIPYFWDYDETEIKAWQKTFYLNPTQYLGFSLSSLTKQ